MARVSFGADGYPRPRGAGGDRAPQIGPGTFECRSDPDTAKPSDFKAIGWCAGPQLPSTELWCYLQASSASFAPIAPVATGSGGGSTTHRLWVDKIGVELAFDPAPTLTDAERRDAFRSYVHLRYQSKHGGSFQSTDWKVQVARPYNNPAPGTPTKKFTIQNSGATLYAVEQPDLESFEVAWVYVAGTHEIWVHYLPGEPDGFCFPGTTDPRTSSTLSNTELRFSFVDDQVRDLGNYLQAINALKTTIIEERHQLNPATANYDDYVVHDFRVEGQ